MFDLTKENICDDIIDLSRRRFLIRSVFAIGATQMLLLPLEIKAGLNFYNERLAFYNKIGFNGQVIDLDNKLYFLGRGYRAYNTSIFRFNSLDSYSPFGPGGINPYTYCQGDPVNLSDPSGHISKGATIFLFVIGILGSILTLGAGIAAIPAIVGVGALLTASLSIVSGIFGTLSGAMGISSILIEENNPTLSRDLMVGATVFGYIALAAGITSMFMSLKQLAQNSTVWLKYSKDIELTQGLPLHHGGPMMTLTKDGLKSGAAFAKYIKSNNLYYPGANNIFRLRSCYGANGGRFSQGQIVANKLNQRVYAWYGEQTKNTMRGLPDVTFRRQSNMFSRGLSTAGNYISHFGVSKAFYMKAVSS
ncbi:hypothetical protein GNP63_14260 [Aliivibrio fischeri]|uniref:RHS repeat-associated core domain-containing protein n=1 Tax=Aliivibrio fischeri TaxID=668 RepID=UPI0012D90069|nr:RHS repeat-associated core domain-containing protein [Aliivibrio fischeri]MUH97697.1 hypothetical protein [Aliivibrio fischeri]MUI62400.1 hypothetical protein [Aliivibrio fischeri]